MAAGNSSNPKPEQQQQKIIEMQTFCNNYDVRMSQYVSLLAQTTWANPQFQNKLLNGTKK